MAPARDRPVGRLPRPHVGEPQAVVRVLRRGGAHVDHGGRRDELPQRNLSAGQAVLREVARARRGACRRAPACRRSWTVVPAARGLAVGQRLEVEGRGRGGPVERVRSSNACVRSMTLRRGQIRRLRRALGLGGRGARIARPARTSAACLMAAYSSDAAPPVRARSAGLTLSALNFCAEAASSAIVSSNSALAPRWNRRGLMRATTKARRYGLSKPVP